MDTKHLGYRLKCFDWSYQPDYALEYVTPGGLYAYLQDIKSMKGQDFNPSFIFEQGTLKALDLTAEIYEALRHQKKPLLSWRLDSPLDYWTRRLHVVRFQTTGLELLFLIKHLWVSRSLGIT